MRFLFTTILFVIPALAWSQKNKPVITGQVTLSTNENTPITIQLTDLQVTDRDDWFYPWGFTLEIHKGDHYSFNDHTVTPDQNFTGPLLVKVTVNDGDHNSDPYMLKIDVIPVNSPPVITGQVALSMNTNSSLQLKLTDLQVSDVDNTYPNDFTLTVLPGANYTVNGTTVTVTNNFKGTLIVNVRVNDGYSDSAPYGLKIEVSDRLRITGQQPITIDEDTSYGLLLSDLSVYDPTDTYPNGFSITIKSGSNYTINGTTIVPVANYNGTLSVDVVVTKGSDSSPPYSLQITVTPINDPPQLVSWESSALQHVLGSTGSPISETLRVEDVDDQQLVLAEIGFRPDAYVAGGDMLVFTNTATIRGVFDPQEGVLSLIGVASLEEYQQALRSVAYQFNTEMELTYASKTIYIKLNDGEQVSEVYEREIRMGENIELSIPNAFTPNSDHANDTWDITPLKKSERLQNAIVRVYNSRGAMVFETHGFDKGWDGSMQGQLLPADTYYYTIDLNMTTSQKKFKGSVTLLR